MPNVITQFITQDPTGVGGLSLYYITSNWVIRCSGNSSGGRKPTTFIRRRQVEYVLPNQTTSTYPQIGSFPREGGHDGNPIAIVLERISRSTQPEQWRSTNGVAWTVAVDEIDAAIEYARATQRERASREVGALAFTPD